MPEKIMPKTELLTRMNLSWARLNTFLDSLTPEQLTLKTDAGGWTVKDHLMHLAVWEDGFVAVLDGENRRERMGVPPEVWHPERWHLGEFDALNAVIQQQHQAKTLDEVRQAHAEIHARLLAHVQAMTDASLQRPIREFDSTSTSDSPILWGIIGNSYGHYGEHMPWMDAIAHGENHPLLSKEVLLARIEKGWNALQAYLMTLSYEQATIPTDAAGWTVKDHLTHLAIWEDGINALLDKQPRAEHMGITRELYETGDYDAINEVIRQQNKDIGLMELRDKFFAVHARLTEKVGTLYDSDLQLLPYHYYQPDSTWTDPVIRWIKMNTYEHYAEHTLWIAAIAAQYQPSVAGLLESIKRGWDILNDFLASLNAAQLTRYTDANGWTVKDHAIHLAVWENGLSAVLDGDEMAEAMGVDTETWKNDHPNGVNAVIQRRYKDKSWAEIDQLRRVIHERLVEQITALTDADLQRPVGEFSPSSEEETPIAALITGNTFAHYSDQLSWMEKIVESGS